MTILTRAYERARTWPVIGYLLSFEGYSAVMLGISAFFVLLILSTPTPWQCTEREAKAAVCARLAEQIARGEVELLDYAQTNCSFRPAAEALGLRTE